MNHHRDLGMGDVARLCGVSRHTAGLWFDAGKIAGYRIPAKRPERRVSRAAMIRFLRDNHMPADGLADNGVLIVGASHVAPWVKTFAAGLRGFEVTAKANPFTAALHFATHMPRVVVVDAHMGRQEALMVHSAFSGDKERSPYLSIILASEDESRENELSDFNLIVRRPFCPRELAKAVRGSNERRR